MPTYNYKCEKCEHEFEEMLSISRRKEPTEVPCERQLHRAAPICGGEIKMKAVAPGIGDPLKLGLIKPDGRYVEKLKEIKKNHPLGTVSAKDYW
jgi:putative FmdB family regulatory protein